ncbi:MAG: hypothetical protein ACTSPW_00170 [Promethearchaeota archaeon]
MKERKINDYITLKMDESGRTVIYLKDKPFLHCMGVVLNIPNEKLTFFNEINSIDEAIEIYNKYLYDKELHHLKNHEHIEYTEIGITPEEEFLVHCSNIQAWVENNYDSRLLHSNLSFPLLKKLTELGDPVAKKVFKEEIARRMRGGELTIALYLLVNNYSEILNNEEQKIFFLENNELLLKKIKAIIKEKNFSKLAFDILGKLGEMGDSLAKKIFKDATIRYIESPDLTDIDYFLRISNINFFNDDEKQLIFLKLNKILLKKVKEINEEKDLSWAEVLFRILKKLKELGDPLAKELLDNEILGNLPNTGILLLLYIWYYNNYIITDKERKIFFLEHNKKLLKNVEDIIKQENPANLEILFKILRKLSDLGDLTARMVLKREIIRYAKSGDIKIVLDLFKKEYLEYFNLEELKDIYLENNDLLLKIIKEKLKEKGSIYSKELIEILKEFDGIGDPLAAKLLKQEIHKHMKSGDLSVALNILTNDFIYHLDPDDRKNVFLEKNDKLLKAIKKKLEQDDINSLEKGFKLLYFLIYSGDVKARRVIKEELVNKLKNGNISAIKFILESGYLEFLKTSPIENRIEINESDLKEIENVFLDENGNLRKPIFKIVSNILLNKKFYSYERTSLLDLLELFSVPLMGLLIKIWPRIIENNDGNDILDIMEKALKDPNNLKKNAEYLKSSIILIAKRYKIKFIKEKRKRLYKVLRFLFSIGDNELKSNLKKIFPHCNFKEIDFIIYNNRIYWTEDNKYLNLSNLDIKHLSEIKGLKKLKELTALDLSDNQLTSLKGIEALQNLRYLNIVNNDIKDFSILDSLKKLKRIDLSICSEKDLKYFKNREIRIKMHNQNGNSLY